MPQTVNKHTCKELAEMQSWSLEQKIKTTQARILEWDTVFEGQVYVSFSGGKDSTVLLDLARRVNPDIPAVFVDTGLEYPEIKEFVKTFDNVTVVRPEKSFRQVIETYGYPVASKEVAECISTARHGSEWALNKLNGTGKYANSQYVISKRWQKLVDAPFKVSGRCCSVMKKAPAKKYEKETGRKAITGSMAAESFLRARRWVQVGCNAFESKRPMSNPMSFWTEQDVLEYIRRFNMPLCSVYGEIKQAADGTLYTMGENRTGCMFCAFGTHFEKEPNRFQRMKKTHPQIWEYCMRPWSEGGLGMREVLEYCGVKYDIDDTQITMDM